MLSNFRFLTRAIGNPDLEASCVSPASLSGKMPRYFANKCLNPRVRRILSRRTVGAAPSHGMRNLPVEY